MSASSRIESISQDTPIDDPPSHTGLRSTDLIDGGERIVVPVHIKGKTHNGKVVEADNVWIYELKDGALRRAMVYVDTASIRDGVLGRGSS